MKVTIYQPARKQEMKVYFMVRRGELKAFIDTGIRTKYPIIKTDASATGFTLDKKEPAMRAKIKRLEALYWEIDEFVVSHPQLRPAAIRDAFMGKKSSDGEGQLVKAIREYAKSGVVGESTSKMFERTATKVADFDSKADFTIDAEWLDKFCAYLSDAGAKVNGIGIHLRNIRTVFNWARKKRITKEYPFLDYKIKVERISVRSMSLEQLRELRDFPCEAWQREYRDIFMLMVYLAGVNIGDLLLCRKLVNGRLEYNRQKTSKPLSIPVYGEAMEIIERYKGKDFLLSAGDRYKDYHGYMHKMNDGLKKIGKTTIVPDKVGKMRKHHVEPVFECLTTYVARYTFASLAAECGVSRDVIAACLGHSWADVTSHYIAYSQKQIDDAVRKVIDYISGKNT